MNALQLVIEPLSPPVELVPATIPVIDGRRLTELIEDFETGSGFHPAGGYGGVVFEFFEAGPLDNYFLEGDNTFVLGCGCGEVGCWPLQCRIRIDSEMVTWDRFSQPHRPNRQYSEFGPFKFDRGQYLHAVSSWRSQVPRVK